MCDQFQKENKFIILAIRSILFIQNEYEHRWNKSLCWEKYGLEKDIFSKAHKKLLPKNRLFVVTNRKNGFFVSKYDYRRDKLDFIL